MQERHQRTSLLLAPSKRLLVAAILMRSSQSSTRNFRAPHHAFIRRTLAGVIRILVAVRSPGAARQSRLIRMAMLTSLGKPDPQTSRWLTHSNPPTLDLWMLF